MTKRLGFTLLELLIVIGIIGLLATLAISALGESQKNARLAGALQFASSAVQGMGATEEAYWNFENGDTTDITGNGNDLSNTGSVVVANEISRPDINFIYGNAYDFPGLIGEYLEYDLPAGEHWGDSFSISMWFRPDTVSGSIFSTVQGNGSTDKSMQISLSACGVEFRGRYGTGAHNVCANEPIMSDEWQHVLVTYDATIENVALYFNGHLANDLDLPGGETFVGNGPDGPVPQTVFRRYRVGCARNGGSVTTPCYDGIIDEVRIYKEPLETAKINSLYAEGAERHILANQ